MVKNYTVACHDLFHSELGFWILMLFFTIVKVFIFSFTGVCLTVIAYIPYWVNVRNLAFLPLNCPVVMIFFILWFVLDSTKRCNLLCVSLYEVSTTKKS